MSKCRESSTLKSVCSNTVEYGVSNSSLESERLRKHVKIAELLTKGTVSNACQKTPTHRWVHYIVMYSQKAPQIVEVSQQKYTGMNVDVLVIWRHRWCRKQNRSQSHVRAGGDTVESQRHVSTIRRVQESVLRQGERRERSDQNTVKGAEWKDRWRGFRRYS